MIGLEGVRSCFYTVHLVNCAINQWPLRNLKKKYFWMRDKQVSIKLME